MLTSQLLLATVKETPADAEVISHQLMLRAGLIRKLASGLYTWLPLGLKVLRKVENIIREEMNASGAQEVLMPVVQPSELWQESGRWEQYGAELLRIKDRHDRDFCLGPTHEEVISDLIRNEIKSYKQLPANFYQIQTKFRDEIRPRFGIMRSREFIMKDAYSFHNDEVSLQQTYDSMYDTYCRIFTRIGVNFRPVIADTGSIGGNASHEFHVLASSGEDSIAYSNDSDYAANVEMAEALPSGKTYQPGSAALEKVATPNQSSIKDVCGFLKTSAENTLKTLIVMGEKQDEDETTAPLIALVLRGDHELNEIKAEKLDGVAAPLTMASDEQIQKQIGCEPGSIGPIKLPIAMIVDHSAAELTDFVCGANETGFHYIGGNWQRDQQITRTADLRNVVVGDPSPDGQGTLDIMRGIEVGHIFQLGKKYSEALNVTVLNENGREQIVTMGCYGIGVTRVVAAAIEQNHDELGIIWPQSIAPFQLAIIPLNMQKSEAVKMHATEIYENLKKAGVDVLLDDRNERPGVKFADMELIGIPHHLVIGDRGLKENKLEYRDRASGESKDIPLDEINTFLKDLLS